MNRNEQILEQLQSELGFATRLVGGKKTVLAQIDRFLDREEIPSHLDIQSQPRLWSRLISEVVVPETSFFRYPESFAMLREWLRGRLHDRLNILCVPCSTGEEAYSLAMVLREAGAMHFHITAVDASERAVAQAREGRYRNVRGLPDEMRSQWFDEDDGALVARAPIRTPIKFEVANIFTMTAAAPFDLIFCRNLLIYFDAGNQHRIFGLLDRWLTPEGVLFLGPGEATTAAAHGWHSTRHSMSFSFQREASAIPRAKIPPVAARRKPAPRLSRPPVAPAPKPTPPAQPEPVDWLARATTLANGGQLDEAGAALARFHENREATAASLFLGGMLDESSGRMADAESGYRKALYLEPDHLDALLHLSLLLENAGRAGSAAPLRRRIERLTT